MSNIKTPVQVSMGKKRRRVRGQIGGPANNKGVPAISVKARGRRRNRKGVVEEGVPRKRMFKQTPTSASMRNERDASTNNVMATLSVTVPEAIRSSLAAVSGYVLGVISYALQRGFATEITDASVPYLAYVYLITVMQGVMSNSIPKVHSVPRWFKRACDGLMPQKHPMANGWIGMNWFIDWDGSSAPYTYDLKPTGLPRTWNIGIIATSPIINGLFHTIGIPPAYTESAGAAAWSSLLNFFKTIGTQYPEQSMVEMTGKSLRPCDLSSFSTPVKILGNSGSGTGGFFNVRSGETPVYSPSSGCFALLGNNSIDEPQRAPMYVSSSAGDSVFYGGAGASTLSPTLFTSQIAPVFKCVDFNQFSEVLNLWVARLAGIASNDAINKEYVVGDPAYYALGMTLQELQLLLRNIMMNAFSDSQFMVQGIYPSDSFNNNNTFLPFVSGQGTYPVPCVGMKLPQLFIENMRSLTYQIQRNANPLSFFPVLGVYQLDKLIWSDYVFTIPGDEADHHVFQDPATAIDVALPVGRKMTPAEMGRLSAETVISLVDGSTGTDFIAVNGPSALQQLTDKWNEWIEKVTPFVQGKLVCVGKDAGVIGLSVLTTTDVHFENQPGHPSMPPSHHVVTQRKYPKRLRTGADVTSTSFYNQRLVQATSSFKPLLANVWETIQSVWIHPDIELNFSNGAPNEIVTLSKWQNITHEMMSLTYTAGDDQFNLFQKHVEYASCMTRYRNGESTVQSELLMELEKNGRGGILSAVIGAVASALFQPPGASVPVY